MNREEAIDELKLLRESAVPWQVPYLLEAIDLAIEALSEDISEDGTLTVKVKDGSKVNRVLVWGDNIFGGLYYPDEGNVQNMHNGMDIEQAVEWCKDCQHNEVCRYYPYDGCQFKDTSERPKGEWEEYTDCEGKTRTITCSECGWEEHSWIDTNYCPNCGAKMGGDGE